MFARETVTQTTLTNQATGEKVGRLTLAADGGATLQVPRDGEWKNFALSAAEVAVLRELLDVDPATFQPAAPGADQADPAAAATAIAKPAAGAEE